MRDFFKMQSRTPLEGVFLIAGLTCRVLTNSELILKHCRKHFAMVHTAADIRFRFWVDHANGSTAVPEESYFRGVGGTICAAFDRRNFVLINLAKRIAAGRFTQEFVEDERGFGRTVFPVLMTTFGPANGVAVIHGACIGNRGRGLVLAGDSGSGKSTLSLALRQLGYECFADDRTYLSSRHGQLLCWGVGGRLKLRPEAAKHFPALTTGQAPSIAGGTAFEVDVAPEGVKPIYCVEPAWLVFLEQKENAGVELTTLAPYEAAGRLEESVIREAPEAVERQLDLIRTLTARPCLLCRYSEPPQVVARVLAGLFSSGASYRVAAHSELIEVSRSPEIKYRDPLRRFTLLGERVPLRFMGRDGVLETNSCRVKLLTERFLKSHVPSLIAEPAFSWRIATEEEDKRPGSPWPEPTGVAAEGVRCVNLGQLGFVAADLDAHEIVGFIAEGRTADTAGFAGVFLAAMAHLTAVALQLTTVSSACIRKHNRGLLLLGPPGCGKTTCAYAAQKLGFETHSDMATFLELSGGQLRAWGEFWPALFREETTRVNPELLHLGQPLVHENETFISVEKQRRGYRGESSINPVMALVLKRGRVRIPRLTQLSTVKYAEALRASHPYSEDSRNQSRRESVFSALLKMPAYKLTFSGDPSEAAVFCRSLFIAHESLEDAR